MFTVFHPELAELTQSLRDLHADFFTGGWTVARQHEHQQAGLRKTLAYVRSNSPFYRKHFAEFTTPELSRLPLEMLPALPFTTKDDLRRAQLEMLSSPMSDAWIFYETTGTTGQATPCPRTNSDTVHNNSVLTAYYRDLFGQYGGQQVVGVSGPSELHATGDTFGDVCRNLGLAVAKLWPHSPVIGFPRAVEVLRMLPATGLFCTPGMALSLARKAIEAGLSPADDFSIDVLMLTGELASPSLLDNIGSLWGARAYNALYASQEASVLAAAGQDGGLYLAPLINHYEIVDPDTLTVVTPDVNGTSQGELVVTNLYQGAKPLVRYRTGDLVRMFAPRPGQSVPAPRVEVLGRVGDRLDLNGHLVTGYDLEDLLLRHVPGFLDYSITIDRAEDGRDRLTLLLQNGNDVERQAPDLVVSACRDELDTPVRIRYGVPGAITGTGAMVSWKAARVTDLRTGSADDEHAAAERVSAGRSR